MENATKALLIAGSVLIAIVLIAVGIKILGSTSDVTDEVDQVSKSMETTMFNSQFTQYGGRQRGSVVKTLLTNIANHNRTASDVDDIGVTATETNGMHSESGFESIMQHLQEFSNSLYYDVSFSYSPETGRISEVHIEDS